MEELLLMLRIKQEKNTNNSYGYYTVKSRLNPYNPLSYLAFTIDAVVGTLFYGVVGYWKNYRNPFKYR